MKLNGFPDRLMTGKPLTRARKSVGVGFNGIKIRSAIANKSGLTPPTEGAVSINKYLAQLLQAASGRQMGKGRGA